MMDVSKESDDFEEFVGVPEYCSECDSRLIETDDMLYCPDCGLVNTASIRYVGGRMIELPFGLKLF